MKTPFFKIPQSGGCARRHDEEREKRSKRYGMAFWKVVQVIWTSEGVKILIVLAFSPRPPF
jgi:hypothetical protein